MELSDVWNQYSKSKLDEASNFVEPKFLGFYLNTIPPTSSLALSIHQTGTKEFGRFGLIELQINDFKTWVAAKKESKRWLLTLDELPLLLIKTEGWLKYKVGHITYYSKQPFSVGEKEKAKLFLQEVRTVEKMLGISVPEVSYFVAHTKEDSHSIVGEISDGAGKGRYRVIKAVNRIDHIHEMVHVLAMETGLINPFFDEGLATAIEPGLRIKTSEDCKGLKNVVNRWVDFLDGSTFNSAHMESRINVYGLSQLIMRYWIKKFGVNNVKKVMIETVNKPDSFRKNIEYYLEANANTTEAIRAELEKICLSRTSSPTS